MNRLAATMAAVLLIITLVALATPGEKDWLNGESLERVEDLSESLANDLLELSVLLRDRNLLAAGKFFSDPILVTPIPSHPSSLVKQVKWIYGHGWKQISRKRAFFSRQEYLRDLGLLLEHFSEIEDVRFKVKQALFDNSVPPVATAQIKIFIIGRDGEGRREWLTAWASILAHQQDEAPWLFRQITLDSIESKVALRDLFSEVAVPAGVSTTFPPFGTDPNNGFVFHGAAVADLNGDGLLDVVTTGVESNYLYLNTGKGDFRDVSAESLVAYSPRGSAPLLLDYDNDGDKDLFFSVVGLQVLLENRFIPDGELQFWDVSGPAKVAQFAVGFSAVSADVDRNGYPDIYVASYNHYGNVMPDSWGHATNGTPNLLFLNQGDGTFREVAAEWGANDKRWSYAAGFADLDADGDQDLYVANDFGENGFYLNMGDRFVDVASDWGLSDPGFGMGVSFGDFNNDGHLDLHVTNMSSTAGNRILRRLYPDAQPSAHLLNKLAAGNSLYRNNGDGTFQDVSAQTGNFQAGWAFGGGFVDFDNDGWEDLYTPNGFISGKSMKDT